MMYSLLPQAYRHKLLREYRVRITICALGFLFVALVVAIISLVPSYLFVSTTKSEVRHDLEGIQKVLTGSGQESISKELSKANVVLAEFAKKSDEYPLTEVVRTFAGTLVSGINMKSFQATRAGEGKTSIDVRIQGSADTRDALVLFKKNLEREKMISNVQLPVSDLAKSKDISFSISMVYSPQ